MGGLILLAFIGICGFSLYKKSKDYIEKLALITFTLICISLISIYLLDRYNIPTIRGLSTNVNTQSWLEIFSNNVGNIGSALISGVILVLVTKLQIDRNNEDSIRRDAENMRIQNMPILKYSLNTEEDISTNTENFIKTKFEKEYIYKLNIHIKNVGLNNIKNIKVDIESVAFIKPVQRTIGQKSMVVMEKGEEINIGKYIPLKHSEKPYEITVKVYYQDVLGNWYNQILEIDYITTNIGEARNHKGQVKYIVKEETLVDAKNIKNL